MQYSEANVKTFQLILLLFSFDFFFLDFLSFYQTHFYERARR